MKLSKWKDVVLRRYTEEEYKMIQQQASAELEEVNKNMKDLWEKFCEENNISSEQRDNLYYNCFVLAWNAGYCKGMSDMLKDKKEE